MTGSLLFNFDTSPKWTLCIFMSISWTISSRRTVTNRQPLTISYINILCVTFYLSASRYKWWTELGSICVYFSKICAYICAFKVAKYALKIKKYAFSFMLEILIVKRSLNGILHFLIIFGPYKVYIIFGPNECTRRQGLS